GSWLAMRRSATGSSATATATKTSEVNMRPFGQRQRRSKTIERIDLSIADLLRGPVDHQPPALDPDDPRRDQPRQRHIVQRQNQGLEPLAQPRDQLCRVTLVHR